MQIASSTMAALSAYRGHGHHGGHHGGGAAAAGGAKADSASFSAAAMALCGGSAGSDDGDADGSTMTADQASAIGSSIKTNDPSLFSQLDGDQDGTLSVSELQDGAKQMIDQLQQMGFAGAPPASGANAGGASGSATGATAAVGASSTGTVEVSDRQAARIGRHMQQDNPGLFTQLDADSDGKLSASEIASGKDAIAADFSQRQQQAAQALFGQIDSDGDGSISSSELSQALSGDGATGQDGASAYRQNLTQDLLNSLLQSSGSK